MLVETPSGEVSLTQTGAGPDLILLHSLLTDRGAFDSVVPHLAARWRVNAVDLPGFGASTPVEPSIDAYADFVAGLLEGGGFDRDTTALMGNGLGGFVALGTAVRHGSLFGKLVLVGCGPTFPGPAKEAFRTMIERVSAGGMEAVTDVAVRRLFTEEYLAAHPTAEDERAAVLLRTDPTAFVTACRALIEVDYRADLDSIHNPTLIVVGSEDQATPPALAYAVREGIEGASMQELAGLGHAPQLEDPDRFLEAVRPLLGL